jgi:hypothetical protein
MNELYRHKKTGGVYEVLTQTAKIQLSYHPEVEDQFTATDFTVYRNIDHGGIYIRPTKEFWDGRFEKLYSEQTGGAG